MNEISIFNRRVFIDALLAQLIIMAIFVQCLEGAVRLASDINLLLRTSTVRDFCHRTYIYRMTTDVILQRSKKSGGL